MKDRLKAALAPGVTPSQFFFDHMPGIHEARLEDFRSVCDIPLIISLWFRDTDRRFTAELSPHGYRAEEGDMIDFPVATICGEEARWEEVKADVLEAVLALHESRHDLERRYGDRRITEQVRRDFEDLRGIIEVSVTGGHAPFDVEVILNDYEPEPRAPSFAIKATKDVVMRMARGQLEPRAASGEVSVRGGMGFAMDLGGFAAEHFDL